MCTAMRLDGLVSASLNSKGVCIHTTDHGSILIAPLSPLFLRELFPDTCTTLSL